MTAETTAPEKVFKRLFKSTIPSQKFIFPNGKEAIFINGRFLTDVEEEIEILNKEVKQGNPHIYIDDKEKEVDVAANPLAEIESKLREKILAEIAAKEKEATNPANDMGTTTEGKLNVANSATVAAAAAGSASGGVAVSLQALAAAAKR